MRICALDLGTHTGVCIGTQDGIEFVETITLATEKELRYARKLRMDRRQDIRVVRLWNKLRELESGAGVINWIVFEDVQFSSSTQQTQLWSSFRSCVWLFAHLRGIDIDCLATGKLKNYATGSGSADKAWMAQAILKHAGFGLDGNRRVIYNSCQGPKILDDNAVDAAHLFQWAKFTFRNTK